jgi:maltose-binding protein MalE
MGGQCYVITKTCKNPELAYQFINYINSAENQIKFVQKNKLLPTRISVYNSDVVKKDSIVMDFKDCMEIMRVRPVFIGGGEIFEEFEPDFKSVLEGKKNPEEAMKNVAEKWKKYVELNILF